MKYKNKSIWTNIEDKTLCSRLDSDIDVDVLIIGGGMTGISTAYHLINKNLKVCVVEKNRVGSGVTSRTTGKLTFLQEKIYSKISNYHGKEKSKLYLDSQMDAIKIVNKIVENEKIDCDLEKVSSYVFTNDSLDKLEEEKSLLEEFGVELKEAFFLPSKQSVNYAFYADDTYVFHPIKYLYSMKEICLKNDLSIYENTKITSIDKKENFYICKIEHNSIKTKYVVLALHYPYFLSPFWMPLKSTIEKSYIEAYKVRKDYGFSAINVDKPSISTRYYVENDIKYQFYLTNSHNLCIKNDEKGNFNNLLDMKNSNPEYLWSNQDIMTIDSLPFIGSINDENTMLIGTGYNTWGMTNSNLAGKILSDIILKQDNQYVDLFSPRRKINVGKVINFPLVVGSNIYSFVKTKLKKNKMWYSPNVRFEKRNGKNVGIYTDNKGKEHIVYNLCPHLKCSLIFNEIEKTWDCPCHGSRFDLDGKSIEGPSNYDIRYEE